MDGLSSGYAFLGSVIGAGVLGFAIDHYFETAPWGMMILLVLGFVGATIRAQREMNADNRKDEADTTPKKD